MLGCQPNLRKVTLMTNVFWNFSLCYQNVLNSSKYVTSLDRVTKCSHITDNFKDFYM